MQLFKAESSGEKEEQVQRHLRGGNKQVVWKKGSLDGSTADVRGKNKVKDEV